VDEIITSLSNPRIKEIRRLRERKYREASGLFYIEGIRLVVEALQQNWPIDTLILAPGLLESPFALQQVDLARKRGYRVLLVSNQVFEGMALKENPQGLAAVARQRWASLSQVRPEVGELWIALEAIQDPGNLGTILRTADAVGAKGVILLDDSADPFDPTTVRASMGAIFSQKVIKARQHEFTQWVQRTRAPLVGTSDKATRDYREFAYPRGMVLMMGSEREGLSSEYAALCQAMVAIPMVGGVDSLNVAVATALILYEIFYQWRSHKHSEQPLGQKREAT